MPVRNTCNCPNPPGGVVECSKEQMALCIIEDGIVRRICQDVVRDKNDLTIVNFALSVITGVKRLSYSTVSESDIRLLRSGEYSEGSNLEVTFSLPEAIIKSLDNIDRNRGLLLR